MSYDVNQDIAELTAQHEEAIAKAKARAQLFNRVIDLTSDSFFKLFEYSHHVKSLDACFRLKAEDTTQFFAVIRELMIYNNTHSVLVQESCTSDKNPVKAEGKEGMVFDYKIDIEYSYTGYKTSFITRLRVDAETFVLFEVEIDRKMVNARVDAERGRGGRIVNYRSSCASISGMKKRVQWYSSDESKVKGHYHFTQYFDESQLEYTLEDLESYED